MNDREIDDMLWRAFYLGLQVMAAQVGQQVSFSDIGGLVRVVREIAGNESTLNDPTALVTKFPELAETFQRLATLNIRHDRDVAKRIFDGFIIATETEE